MASSSTAKRAVVLGAAALLLASIALLFLQEGSEASTRITPPTRANDSGKNSVEARESHEVSTRSTVPAASSGPWASRRGMAHRYRFDSRNSFALAEEDPKDRKKAQLGGGEAALHFAGTLLWIVHDRNAEGILTSIQMGDLKFKQVDNEDADIRSRIAALEEPVYVWMHPHGVARGIAFPKKFSLDVQDFVRTIVATLCYRLGTESGAYPGAKTWKSRESDATGAFEAEYRFIAQIKKTAKPRAEFQRTKLRYTKISASVGDVPKHRIAGKTRIVSDASRQWLHSVRVDESVAMKTPGFDATFRVDTLATVEWLTSTRVERTVELASFEDFEAKDFVPPGAETQASELSAEGRLDMIRQELEGKTLLDMLNALRDALAQHGEQAQQTYEAWAQLGEYLEIDPKAAAELLAMLQSGRATGGMGDLLTSALGAAGNAEAQSSLQQLMSDPNTSEALREGAIVSTQQLAQPTPETFVALEQQLERAGDFDAFKSSSVLALGTLSGRSSRKNAKGRNPIEELLAKEQQAEREGWLDTWLEALGNTANRAVFDTVLRYTKHADAGLRGFAIRILPRIPDDRVVASLRARARIETDPRVRLGLVDSLAECPRGAADLELRAMITSDQEAIASRALDRLSGRLDLAENLSFVRSLSLEALSAKLRERAKQILEEHAKQKNNKR